MYEITMAAESYIRLLSAVTASNQRLVLLLLMQKNQIAAKHTLTGRTAKAIQIPIVLLSPVFGAPIVT